MPNMFNVLYTRYIDQIKLQQVQDYNKKHKDYLIRSGKQSQNPQQYTFVKNQTKNQFKDNVKLSQNQNYRMTSQVQSQNVNIQNPRRKRQFPTKIQKKCNQQNFIPQQRPIKPAQNNFNFNQIHQQSYGLKDRQFKPKIQNPKQRNKYSNYPIENQSKEKLQQRPLKPKANITQNQYPDEEQDVVLQECPQGCGRKFKLSALQKHIKICQKVFQGKRKQFKVQIVDDQAKKLYQKNGSRQQISQKPKNDKIPKWKKQSQLLRRGLKAAQQGGSTQSIPFEEQDDRIQCGGCGRKFNQTAASKHIPNCIKRNKQKY